ncbi:hypothetical protein EVJ58_g10746 [Rhodofomes roseus]|uniref:Uncharacterized protein n=1 Tax=Rhodofomes roseus TaxID=34475 RepID=A0A4Y9XMV2_9APHY|nr:hypothetical protein EVJ58_g10746 [Rhodofomes roseus]
MDIDDISAFLDDDTWQLPPSSPAAAFSSIPGEGAQPVETNPTSRDGSGSPRTTPHSSPSPEPHEAQDVLRPVDNQRHASPLSPEGQPQGALHTTAPQRREADLQFLDAQAAAKRLKPEAKEQLRRYILAPDGQRAVMAYATSLSIAQSLGALAAPDAPWVIPEAMKTNINKYVIRLLLSSEIGVYDGELPVNKVMSLVEAKILTGTNLAQARDADDGKWNKMEDWARYCLTQRKGEIKKRIEQSFDRHEFVNPAPYKNGKDIIKLVKGIIKIGSKSVKHTGVVATAALCSRFAVLRDVLKNNPDKEEYWSLVDEALRKIRTKGKGNDIATSRIVQVFLDKDRKYWPGPELSTLSKNRPTRDQTDINDFARSLSTALTPTIGSSSSSVQT